MPAPSEPAFTHAFARGLRTGDLPAGITATAPEEAERRFAVYRNNVAHGLSRALAARFPVIERLLGEEYFAALARAYLAASPPHTPQLYLWGDDFAAFLAAFPPLRPLPYLPDVARLEWLRGLAWHAADAEPVGAAELAAAAQAPADLRLRFHPSVTLLRTRHAAVTIWAANQPGAPPQEIDAMQPEAALVLRDRNDVVQVLSLSPSEAEVAAGLIRGLPLMAAIALATTPGLDPGGFLFTLVRHGALTAFTTGESA